MIRSTLLWLAILGAVSTVSAHQTAQTPNTQTPSPSPRLDAVVLQIPVDLPGYFRDENSPKGLYSIDVWVRFGSISRIEPKAAVPEVEDPGLQRVFAQLQSLLRAYQEGDVSAVLALYEPQSRVMVQAQLADPKLRSSWIDSISKVESFEPLILWEEDGMYRCLMHMEAIGAEGRRVFAVSFDTQLDLTVGELKKPMHTNLFRYFADSSRKPEHLVANYAYLQERLR